MLEGNEVLILVNNGKSSLEGFDLLELVLTTTDSPDYERYVRSYMHAIRNSDTKSAKVVWALHERIVPKILSLVNRPGIDLDLRNEVIQTIRDFEASATMKIEGD